jgi:Flp pilus assembly protein TadG
MKTLANRFAANRRSAIAMVFALSLVPLVLLVGLAIDYSFYVQTSLQVNRAAEAAAIQAVRTAAAGYALDIDHSDTVTQATTDAISDGELAGQKWFAVQASNLVRGSAGTPSVTVQTNSGGNGGAGFNATVSYTFTYPPFFNSLFGDSNSWVHANSATAEAGYQYVEVLLLLDTSASMEIGANQSDIATLSDNSICLPQISNFDTLGMGAMYAVGVYQYPYDQYGSQMVADGDTIDFSKITSVKNPSVYTYIDPSGAPTDVTGSCNTAAGYGIAVGGYTASEPDEPCALACHTTSTIVNGNFADLYGQARSLGVTLRLDVVMKAAEQIAQDLYNSEQASNQFTLGVYQFNSDVSAMVDGGSSTEATTNLTGAKTTLESYDYAYSGNAALLPALQTLTHNTNFPLAITHLVNGGGSVPQLQAVTNTQSEPAGSVASDPIKNIFIVTDGFEDASNANGLSLDFGEMTSSTAENYYTSTGSIYNGSATGYCAALKRLGFNVYVLYVTYYPVPIAPYYKAVWIGGQANYADSTDFSSAFPYGTATIPRALAEATSSAETIGTNPDLSVPASAGEVSPDEEALEACASNGDFYTATSSSDITDAMSAMLSSAIYSSIVVTK